MAKRKRLTPPVAQDLARAPEVKAMFPETSSNTPSAVPPAPRARLSPGAAPIADMAGAAAAQAALEEVSAELSAVRAEGRLIQKLPTAQIDPAHLMRDRLLIDEDDLQVLMASIRKRGQQTPIEVLATGPESYGLISGSRRFAALARLHEVTGNPRYAEVQALIRQPASAREAYVAMVEENEVRVGLSYYERAQIVARTVEAGVYPDAKKALQTLFASASRAKRSKIKSFLPIVERLGPVLRHPAALGERLGLELSQRLAAPDMATALAAALSKAAAPTAEAEQEVIAEVLSGAAPETSEAPSKSLREAAGEIKGEDLAQGIRMVWGRQSLSLIGPGVTEELVAELRALLAER